MHRHHEAAQGQVPEACATPLCLPSQIQFHIKGPSGTGLVHADMYKDALGQWAYSYLLVDVYSAVGGSGAAGQPTRLHIVRA